MPLQYVPRVFGGTLALPGAAPPAPLPPTRYVNRALGGPIPILSGFKAPFSVTPSGAPQVWVNGAAATALEKTLTFDGAIGRRSQAGCVLYGPTSVHYEQDQQVSIYDKNGVNVFTGYIVSPQEVRYGSLLETTITATDRHRLADKRVVAAAYTNKTCGFMVQDILNNILASEGVTIGQIFDGLIPSPTLYPSTTLYPLGNVGLIPSATFVYCTVAQAFDALAKEASSAGIPYYWQIDSNNLLWFVPYTAVTGPAVDGTRIDGDGKLSGVIPTVTRANPTYRNTQYILGGVAQTVTQTEIQVGDGSKQSFTMGFGISSAPTVSCSFNGGAYIGQTVGIKGGIGSQWYWAQGDPILTQDSAQPKLRGPNAPIDLLKVIYTGQYPTVIASSNQAQIAYSQSLAGDSGIVEAVQTDNTLTSVASGLSEASQLLTRYATQGTQFVFATLDPSYAAGQLRSFTYAPYGFNGTQMLITNVSGSDSQDGFNLWWTITAVAGPYDISWTDFFSTLLQQVQVANSINVGVSQSIQLLASFAASLTPTATFTTTPFACPLPSSSLFPAVGLFPC